MPYIIDRPSEIENMSLPEEFYAKFGQNFETVERFNSKRKNVKKKKFFFFFFFGWLAGWLAE